MASSPRSLQPPASAGASFHDLHDYAFATDRSGRQPAERNSTTWTVTDDWPNDVPVAEAEIAVFEAWFGDLFDELFGER